MTLDEAIKDLEYGTKQLEMEIESGLWIKGSEPELSCKEGIALNKQHIEWLTELKDLREKNKVLTNECDRLIKEKGEFLKKSEQIAEYKRLLKAAVDDMKTLVRCDSVQDCLVCKYQLRDCDGFAFEWKHMEDVNNLINPIE